MMAVLSVGTGDHSVTVDVDGYGAFGRQQLGTATGDALIDLVGPTGPTPTVFYSATAIGGASGRRLLTDGDIGIQSPLPAIAVNVNPNNVIAISSFSFTGYVGSLAVLNGLSVNLTQTLSSVSDHGQQAGAHLTQAYTISNTTATTKAFDLVRYIDVDNIESAEPQFHDGGGRVVVDGEEWLVTTSSPRVSNLNPSDFFVAIATDGGIEPITNRFEVEQFSFGFLGKTISGAALDDSVHNDSADPDQLIDVETYDTAGILRTQFSIAPGGTAAFVAYTMFADTISAPIDLLKPEVQRAPRVLNVTISGSTSTHAPHSFNGLDDFTDADGSGQQLITVPVGNANSVEITFSEHVTNVQASHLTLTGLRYGTVPTLASGGFSYNSATHKAKWRFNAPFASEEYSISLSDAITDSNGNQLDGEWVNPKFTSTQNSLVSRFPSGNAVAGGQFKFVFTILPGDVSFNNLVNSSDYYDYFLMFDSDPTSNTFAEADFNGDGTVNTSDEFMIFQNVNRNFTGLAVADFNSDGNVDSADYTIYQDHLGQTVSPWTLGDTTGDGLVDVSDYQIWTRQFGMQLLIIG